MIISFVVPSQPVPMGGVTAIYEFANGLARRGHEVHMAHGKFWDRGIDSLEEIAWFDFAEGIHHYLDSGTGVDLPDADVIFGTEAPARMGLPVLLVQGLDMFPKDMERKVFRTPCLKVCVAGWLVDAGLRYGSPPEQLVHVPMGIDHDLFCVTTPLEERSPRVGVLHHRHPAKGWYAATKAIQAAREEVPEMEVVVFGSFRQPRSLPEGATFVAAPDQPRLATDVYNRCRVFLQSSRWEGFGFTAVEAMACGAALVSTDNGGSRDYAIHGQTALVAPPGDGIGLGAHLATLLRDDALRLRIARAGVEHVQRFTWDRGAALLEQHLESYVADPDAYRRPPLPVGT